MSREVIATQDGEGVRSDPLLERLEIAFEHLDEAQAVGLVIDPRPRFPEIRVRAGDLPEDCPLALQDVALKRILDCGEHD